MYADDDVIAKFAGADLTKGGDGSSADMNFTMPREDMSITFTPGDLAMILKNKIIDQHYDELALKALYDAEAEVYKRNVNTAERRSLASEGNALSDGSYPIANAGDLHNAAHLAATGHGNAEGAKRLIARRAKELGVANPLDDSEKGIPGVTDTQPEVVKDTAKEAEPEITKDPEADDKESAELGNKAKKPKKKMPPWMQDDDDKDDSKGDSDCKTDHAHTEKCHVDPKTASGATDAADMKPAPVGELVESPMPAGRKYEEAAILRFKSLGIDSDMGRLHDLTCPAYDPEDVFKYHPLADFKSLVDEGVWQRLALDAAAGKPLSEAFAVQKAWQAAVTLKSADMAELNDYRRDMHKAFRDANPGPTSYPSPGSISPGGFCRPVITAGHAANSPGYDSPNSSPSVASGPVGGAGQFDRPPLSAGHQSPSPSHMKTDFEYPGTTGVPMHLNYAVMEKERARMALSTLHEHLSHQFPMACPMIAQDPNAQPERSALPAIEGIGKAVEPAQAEAAVSKSPDLPQDVLDSIKKGMKKKLGKKVLAGTMTVDEARAKMGRRRAQKTADYLSEMVEKGAMTIDEARAKVGLGPWKPSAATTEEIVKAFDAGAKEVTFTGIMASTPPTTELIIKAAVSDAIAPLIAKIQQQEEMLAKAEETAEKVREQEARWETVANLSDPNTASWAGLAMNPLMKNARPAGVTTIAENAERTQATRRRLLEETVRTSENAYEREAARAEIFRKFTE
jgi:hypothetical protein